MKVSVLLTTYNRLALLSRAVESVLIQEGVDKELVIVDDASTDGTREYLVKLQKQYPNLIKLVLKDQNTGLANSRNLGVKSATGDYIAFLDDDDYWLSSYRLERMLPLCADNRIACASVLAGNKPLTPCLPKRWRRTLLYRNGFIHTSTVIIKKSLIQKIGGFDERLTKGIDSDLYRRLVFDLDVDLQLYRKQEVYYETKSPNRITESNVGWRRLARAREAFYLNRKYLSYFRKEPLSYLRRIYISVRSI